MNLSNEDASTTKQQQEDFFELIERNPYIFAQFERLLNLLIDLNIITPISKGNSKLNNSNGKRGLIIENFSNLPLESENLVEVSKISAKESSADIDNLEYTDNLIVENNLAPNFDNQPTHLLSEEESPKQVSPDVSILEQPGDLLPPNLPQPSLDSEPQPSHLQAEESTNYWIQDPETIEETPEASSNESIHNNGNLDKTAEPSPNYSIQDAEILKEIAEVFPKYSIQDSEILEATAELFPNPAIQDNEILGEATSFPNDSIKDGENLAQTQDLNTNISQDETLASELHRLLNAEKESANESSQNDRNLEQTKNINISSSQAENMDKPPLNIQQDRTLIIEDKIANIEHIINDAFKDRSYDIILSSIEDKLNNIEHCLYEPTELINLIMPAIADIINRQRAESKEEIMGAIAPMIDASIQNKTKQDSDAISEVIASTISRQMHDYHQEIADAITKQVNLEREAIANALVPVIEKTIAKHIANSERAFSFNKAIGNIAAKLQIVKVPPHTNAVPSLRQKRPSLRIAGLFFLSLIFLPLGFLWYRNGIERRIEETTAKALESAPELSMYRIGVDANNGIIRLSGKVPNQNLRQKAGQLANKVAGGLKLDNDIITVKVPVDPAVTAAEVKRVTSILNETNGVAIKAKYTAGKVTVEGTVKQDADIKKIVQAIKQVPGVKSVSNKLQLEPNAIATRIYFPPGSAKLNNSDISSKILLVKNFLERYPQQNIRIIGNTDANSNQPKYQQLALKRAESVRDALVNKGVDTKRLQVTARTNRPGAVDANQPAWLSRSVEFEAIAPAVKTKQSSKK